MHPKEDNNKNTFKGFFYTIHKKISLWNLEKNGSIYPFYIQSTCKTKKMLIGKLEIDELKPYNQKKDSNAVLFYPMFR